MVGLSLLGLLLLSHDRWAPWIWALVLVPMLSLAVHGGNPALLVSGVVPLAGLTLVVRRCRLERTRFIRLLTLLGALIATHALVSFLAFRLAGGAHRWRPPIENPWLQSLVWPYYCDHYPRGAHAVGLFLNDNLLGVWCVAILCLALTIKGKGRFWLALPLLLTVGWSYSRSAYLALLGSMAWLAWRRERRLVLLPALIPILFLAFDTGLDQQRFGVGWRDTLGGRWEQLTRAAQTLGSGSLLGNGPGSAGLVDSQWAKTALELGWLGVLVYAGFFLMVMRAAQAQPGLQAALLALGLGALGCDLFYSPHLAATFFLLAGYAAEVENQEQAEAEREGRQGIIP